MIRARSTFETGAEGWTIAGGAGTATLVSDARANRYLEYQDQTGTEQVYFVAPAKFLGDLSALYNDYLVLDVLPSGPPGLGRFEIATPELVIRGSNGVQLVNRTFIDVRSFSAFQNVSADRWQELRFLFAPVTFFYKGWFSGWKMNTSTGPDATEQDLRSVLKNVTYLAIRPYNTQFSGTKYTIDNVELGIGFYLDTSELSFTQQRCVPDKLRKDLSIDVNRWYGIRELFSSADSREGWLSVSAKSATLPVSLGIVVDVARLPKGRSVGTVTLSTNPVSRLAERITVTVDSPDQEGPAISGVANAASFQPQIFSPGSWISITGRNLTCATPVGRIWKPGEIVGGKLPVALDGVSVTINNKPAFIYYVSSTQLNVQAPDDTATGNVLVEVSTGSGYAATTASLRQVAGGLFAYRDSTQILRPSALNSDGSYIGVQPGTRPARPGDTIVLYGTGFGPTAPAKPAGQIIEPAPLATSVFSVVVGNQVARVQYAGLVSPGLYQFNVVVPDLRDGDHELFIAIGGAQTQKDLMLAVQRQ